MEATLKRSTPWSEFFTFAGSSSNATTQPSIRSTKTTCAKRILYYPADHGRNMVGDTGDVSPPLFQTGDIICHVPPTFFSRFCVSRGFKKNSDACHDLFQEFFMLDGRPHSQVDVETFWCGITDFC